VCSTSPASAAFQGGFIPDVILYASYFYTKKELPLRLAFFWMINYFGEQLLAGVE
jgi:hypothetical protein